MGVVARLFRREPVRSADLPLTLEEYISFFNYSGATYPLLGLQQSSPGVPEERIGQDFVGLCRGAYKSNGVVFACMLVRMLLFAEARFQFRQLRSGRPGDLFGNADLAPLETPWPGGTTGDLLARSLQYADIAGNSFTTVTRGGLKLLRPDWVTIILGGDDPDPLGMELAGYAYTKGGIGSGNDPVILLPGEVAHFAPIPDPEAAYRGMSWLTPVIREIMADKATTSHKLQFFENGATPNMVVNLTVDIENFDAWVAKFREQHEGRLNAYKTMFLGAGADAKVVGANLKEIDFKATQGAGETRIAAAAGVPPVIVGLSEGLDAATYSNYAQARRRFADGTMRPLWRNMAASLSRLIRVPRDAELWYDDRDIPFLQEDVKDATEILAGQAAAIKTLVDGGFDAATVVDAVMSGDLSRLKHTGLFSVQLQPAGTTVPAPSGNGPVPAVEAEAAARQLLGEVR